jgi:hypothetical protein
MPVNLVHQDALQAGFLAARRELGVGGIIHLVSRDAAAPTAQDIWHVWMEHCGRPEEVRYYRSFAALDLGALEDRQRLIVDIGESNIDISSRRWAFEMGSLDRLRARGLVFRDADLESMRICFDYFLTQTPRAINFAAQRPFRAPPRVVLVGESQVAMG